jgi:phosphoribosylformylglycinamidine (FGAM) synthase-like enzyme
MCPNETQVGGMDCLSNEQIDSNTVTDVRSGVIFHVDKVEDVCKVEQLKMEEHNKATIQIVGIRALWI